MARLLHFTAALAVAASACGGKVVSTARYASTTGQEVAWKPLLPGQRVVLHAPEGVACPVHAGGSFAELEKGGTPLSGHESTRKARVFDIVDSQVKTGLGGFVALQVREKGGATSWLKLPAGSEPACVFPAPAGIDEVAALAGKKLGYAPWRQSCRTIQAVGEAPAAMLVDAEPGLEFEVDSVAIGAASASARAAGKAGGELWAVLNGGALEVRADTLKQCFVPAGTERPAQVTEFVRLPLGRCTQSDDEGQPHVECRSTLGVWSGTRTDRAVELRAVRRTLGAVHFVGERPVAGARYAKAVVAVTQGAATDPRGALLNQALDQAVKRAIENDPSGSVRVAPSGSPDVTYKLHVQVSDLNIGPLEKQNSTGQSQYKIRDEVRDNPDKPAARQRVEVARGALGQAETDYAEEVRRTEALKQAAIETCRRQAEQMKSDSNRTAVGAACDIGSIAAQFIQPSRDGVQSARDELTNAQAALAGMPDTITVPIMGTHTYPKLIYRRATSATLALSMQGVQEASPSVLTLRIAHRWEDFEVEGDAAHNVKEHRPDPRPIRSDDALVPFVAERASAELAVRLRAALSQAAVEQAKRAFAEAGNPPPKPGFEAVDAIAFDIAGKRLERVVLQGEAQLTDAAPFALPVRTARPAAGGCVLAVAVADGGAATALSLSTPDGAVADLRASSMAVVEACGDEVAAIKTLALSSKTGGAARWGLYLTRSEDK